MALSNPAVPTGTAADQFGAEASRGVWRVALDALWAPGEASRRYLTRVARHLVSRLDEEAPDGAGFTQLLPSPSEGKAAAGGGCRQVRSALPDWHWTPFMYGPLAAALLPVTSLEERLVQLQQRALELLKARGASTRISEYYNGAWLAITTATLNGDLAASCAHVLTSGCRAPSGRTK